jgi:uncharacterized protein
MRRHEAVGAAQLCKGVDRLGLLQIDSVNILVRAQYLPLFSRLGSYEHALLDALMAAKPKRFFEYWGHEASQLPIECQPLLRWRMARGLRGRGVWRQLEPFAGEKRGEADALLARIETEGPLAASDVADTRASKGMKAIGNRVASIQNTNAHQGDGILLFYQTHAQASPGRPRSTDRSQGEERLKH